ncbi:TPA: cysteine dioxygenase, partial [Pseudomonas aeruginosa]
MHFRNKKAFATVPPELPGVNPRMSSILRLDRLRQFIGELATLLDSRPDESTL